MQKIVSLLTVGTMILTTTSPVLASEFLITGNGSDSTNTVTVSNANTTSVVQENKTDVRNKVKVNANTGDNDASDNTGGDVTIETGDADVEVHIDNMLNSNVADVDSCNGCYGDSTIKVTGNGTGSTNDVDYDNDNLTSLFQSNVARVDNDVDAEAETGENTADDNTGGDVLIISGDADVKVKATTEANSNTAAVTARGGSEGGVEILVSENGSYTDNEVDLDTARVVLGVQDNRTMIRNRLKTEAETGDNTADDNTGGDVGIGSGDSDIWAEVMNSAGFNHFDAGDCCTEAVMAKIAANGTESDNEVKGEVVNTTDAFQSNRCGDWCFDNDFDIEGETGENTGEDNTGDADSDPVILTGDSDVMVKVSNEGGSNVYGQQDPVNGLGMTEGLEVSITFDMAALMEYLGL